jgi:hypothetical protein
MCARCRSPERKATWHVLQVKGCVDCTEGAGTAWVAMVRRARWCGVVWCGVVCRCSAGPCAAAERNDANSYWGGGGADAGCSAREPRFCSWLSWPPLPPRAVLRAAAAAAGGGDGGSSIWRSECLLSSGPGRRAVSVGGTAVTCVVAEPRRHCPPRPALPAHRHLGTSAYRHPGPLAQRHWRGPRRPGARPPARSARHRHVWRRVRRHVRRHARRHAHVRLHARRHARRHTRPYAAPLPLRAAAAAVTRHDTASDMAPVVAPIVAVADASRILECSQVARQRAFQWLLRR